MSTCPHCGGKPTPSPTRYCDRCHQYMDAPAFPGYSWAAVYAMNNLGGLFF